MNEDVQDENSQISQLSSSLPSFFSYYSNYHLLLCSICHVAVRENSVISHLKKHASSVEIENAEFKKTLSNLSIYSFEKSLELLVESNFLVEFSELNTIKNGFVCTANDCLKVFISSTTLHRHLSVDHNIKTKKQQKNCFQSCFLQALVDSRRYLFQVHENVSENFVSNLSNVSSDADSENKTDEKLMQDFLQNISHKKQLQQQKLVLLSKNTRDEASAFQNEAKYSQFLHNRDLKKLVSLLYFEKTQDDFKNQFISLAVDYLLAISEKKLTILNRSCSQLLNSFSSERIVLRKFKAVQQIETLQKYSLIFKKFITFLCSSFELFSYVDDVDNESFKNLFKLRTDTKDLLRKFISLMNNAQTKNTNFSTQNKQFDDENSDENNDDFNNVNDDEFDNSDSFDEETDSDSNEDSSFKNQLRKIEQKFNKDYKNEYFSNSDVIAAANIVLQIIISTFKHKTNATFDNAINSFFAILSIDIKHMTLSSSAKLSQLYSHFIYCSQLSVVSYCCSLYISRSSFAFSSRLSTFISNFMTSYFHNSSETALAEILALRAYAFKVNKQTSTEIHDIMMIDFNVLKIDNKTFSTQSLTTLFHKSILKAADLLFKQLLLNVDFMSDLSSITLFNASQYENINNKSLHANFLSQNTKLQSFSTFLQQKVTSSSKLRKHFFIKQSAKFSINYSSVNSYFAIVAQFLKTLLFLFHVTGGAPSRDTELCSLMHSNSITNARNLFLDSKNHLFLIKLRYSKSFSVTQKEQSAIRLLPQSVSYLTLIYLTVVLPFIQFLNYSTYEKASDASYLLFFTEKKLLKSADLFQMMKSLSTEYIGQSLNIALYRHVILTFIRQSMNETLLDDIENQNSIESIAAEQMHHSTQTASLAYSRQDFHLSNIDIFSQEHFTKFSLQYHAFFQLNSISLVHFQSAFLHSFHSNIDQNSSSFSTSSDALKSRKKHALSISSNVSSAVIKKVKLNDLSFHLSFLNTKLTDNFADSNEIDMSDLDQHDKIALVENDEIADFSFLQKDVFSALLQDFFQDSTVSFKTVQQRLALQSILQKKSCLTIVLPTAGGKSLLFLLTASLTFAKTTIVIVPLVSLKENLKKQAFEFDISCSNWEEKKTDNFDSLILVSVESVANSAFISFVKKLHALNFLDRIIFDECHMIVLTAHYRTFMHQLKQLRMIQTQFVFLTATLTQKNEKKLNDMMLLDNNLIIRAQISQKNIYYSVRDFESNTQNAQIDEIIRFIRRKQTNKKQKFIVYAMSKSLISAFVSHYSSFIAYFHADLSTEMKKQQLHAFESAEKLILVTTSALSAGFDFENISYVIHIYSSYSFTEFVQETDRLSRQNQQDFSIVFTTSNEKSIRKTDTDERVFMRQYLNEKICRRRLLKLVFDDIIIEECEDFETKCDICESRQKEQLQSEQRLLQYNQKTTYNRSILVKYLLFFQDKCLFCFFNLDFFERPSSTTLNKRYQKCFHKQINCKENIENDHIEDYLQYYSSKKQMSFQKDSCCFNCLLPTVICKNYQTKTAECQFSYFLFDFIIFTWYFGSYFFEEAFDEVQIISFTDFQKAENPTAFKSLFFEIDFDFFNTESIKAVIFFVEIMNV